MNSQLPSAKDEKKTTVQVIMEFYPIAHSIVGMFAMYLSFRCNNGFKFSDFIFACLCPWAYVIYRLATTGICNLKSKS
jgi:hypothetical protein